MKFPQLPKGHRWKVTHLVRDYWNQEGGEQVRIEIVLPFWLQVGRLFGLAPIPYYGGVFKLTTESPSAEMMTAAEKIHADFLNRRLVDGQVGTLEKMLNAKE